MPRLLISSLILLASLMLNACGFQLKGSRALPPELAQVHLDYRKGLQVIDARVVEEVEAQLIRRGARVSRVPFEGASRLTIQHPDSESRTQSVGADGDEVEFEVITSVRFSLEVAGKERIPEQAVVTRRDYSFNSGQALSKQIEDDRLREDMETELAGLVLLQIESRLAPR